MNVENFDQEIIKPRPTEVEIAKQARVLWKNFTNHNEGHTEEYCPACMTGADNIDSAIADLESIIKNPNSPHNLDLKGGHYKNYTQEDLLDLIEILKDLSKNRTAEAIDIDIEAKE